MVDIELSVQTPWPDDVPERNVEVGLDPDCLPLGLHEFAYVDLDAWAPYVNGNFESGPARVGRRLATQRPW